MKTRGMMGIMGVWLAGCVGIMAFNATWEPSNTPLPPLSNGIGSHSVAILNVSATTAQSFVIQVSSALGRYLIREGAYEGREGEMAPYRVRLNPMGDGPLTHTSTDLDQWVYLDAPVEWLFTPTGESNEGPMRVSLMLSSPPNPSLFRGQFKAHIGISITEKI